MQLKESRGGGRIKVLVLYMFFLKMYILCFFKKNPWESERTWETMLEGHSNYRATKHPLVLEDTHRHKFATYIHIWS